MTEQTPTPLSENTTRRAESAAEAIYGDKQAALVENTIPNSAGSEVLEAYEAAKEVPKDVTAEAAGRAASLLAAHQEAKASLAYVSAAKLEAGRAASAGNWPQERLDYVLSTIDRKYAAK